MSKSSLSSGGQGVIFGGTRPVVPDLQSGHKSPKSSPDWWNPCGIYDGAYTNLDPDLLPAAINTTNAGARAVLWEDTGWTDVEVVVRWLGIHGRQAAPLVCINEDSPMYGLGMWWEVDIYEGQILIWEIGRMAPDIEVHESLIQSLPGHIDGTPVDIKIRVKNNVIKTFLDDVLIYTFSVPVGLQGSTKHGLSVDVNTMDFPVHGGVRLPNEPCAVAPYTIREIPPTEPL